MRFWLETSAGFCVLWKMTSARWSWSRMVGARGHGQAILEGLGFHLPISYGKQGETLLKFPVTSGELLSFLLTKIWPILTSPGDVDEEELCMNVKAKQQFSYSWYCTWGFGKSISSRWLDPALHGLAMFSWWVESWLIQQESLLWASLSQKQRYCLSIFDFSTLCQGSAFPASSC